MGKLSLVAGFGAIFASIMIFSFGGMLIKLQIPSMYYLSLSEEKLTLLVIGIVVLGIAWLASGIVFIKKPQIKSIFLISSIVCSALFSGVGGTGIFLGQIEFGKGEINLDKLQENYSNLNEWTQRKILLQQGILNGMELSPFPSKTPLNSVIHGYREYSNHSVANVYFESVPGFFVTGNLYRPFPLNESIKKPIIALPHGHFSEGAGGRFIPDMQNLATTLARMGAIVFTYDMVGWGDSTQVEHEASKVLKLQSWNSIRVIDFLLSFSDADPDRIGVSGASGGGTQTFLLGVIDDRVDVITPVVMVSSWFFDLCSCEGGMPIHKNKVNGTKYTTNNAEITALFAPKPLLIVSDGNDWTATVPYLEYPFIQGIYDFYNARQNVSNVHLADEGHDFGLSKRTAVYDYFTTFLSLNSTGILLLGGQYDESANVIENPDTMRAFNIDFPRPSEALMGQEAVLEIFSHLQ